MSEPTDERLRLLDDLERKIGTDPVAAAQSLREFLIPNPFNAPAYRLLARALDELAHPSTRLGSVRANAPGTAALLDSARAALCAKDYQTAGTIVRDRLLTRPGDIDALCLMAELAFELNYELDAENLVRLALEFEPDSASSRIELARLLNNRDRSLEAMAELERVLRREPDNLFAQVAYAAALGRSGQYEDAAKLYGSLLQRLPGEAPLWTTYGQLLKTMGRADEGVAAMRRATQLAPRTGENWWNIANVKTAAFDVAEIATMGEVLDRNDLSPDDRAHIHFALGKAFEDGGDPAEAFVHYRSANAIRHQSFNYDSEAVAAQVDTSIRLFTRKFFEERTGWGSAARDPIFVVGMPRAGSTLIEQILASHASVEGTRELLAIPTISAELGQDRGGYFRNVGKLDREECRSLGEDYIARTRGLRVTDRPFFVDKMPDNWLHVGLIHLLLPNAKIIDARRHPLACGFSNYKQNYLKSHLFSYDLGAIGRHYRDYVRLMAHFDAVLPGRIHRVFHEALVENTESEIRRMLDYLELPFDPACLRFHETERPVRTPSSEQVRRPIRRQGVDQWRAFEPWLDELKAALGPVLDAYPEVPEFGFK
ncbi:MAG: sulfotransferase [Sphingomonas sp.]